MRYAILASLIVATAIGFVVVVRGRAKAVEAERESVRDRMESHRTFDKPTRPKEPAVPPPRD